MYMSDEPARDAERYMADLDKIQERRPKCLCCGRPIQNDWAFHYRENEYDFWLCNRCLRDNEEYVEVD